MPRIQGSIGESLAKLYDIAGSKYRLNELMPGDVQLVHELGHVRFAELFSVHTIRLSSGSVAQSTSWQTNSYLVSYGRPLVPYRIQSILVREDTISTDINTSIDNMSVVLHPVDNSTDDTVLWAWKNAISNQFSLYGAWDGVMGNHIIARAPVIEHVPYIAPRWLEGPNSAYDQPVALYFYGTTKAFGAGNIEMIADVTVAFAGQYYDGTTRVGPEGSGLPIPSW